LKKKINDNGYKAISVEEIHEINTLQAKQFAQGLIGLDIIKKTRDQWICIRNLQLHWPYDLVQKVTLKLYVQLLQNIRKVS
jgi:hypothetical protein